MLYSWLIMMCVCRPDPWPLASSESPLDNKAEIKEEGERGETDQRGESARTRWRGRLRGRETDGEEEGEKV